jgi:tryptophanyl-tRNA synthetase
VSKDIVFSGMRPTGRLHIGNYWGALKNWVDLQSKYPCIFSVADWHMLTTGYDDTTKLQDNIREMVLDWLAAGVDPDKAIVFKQSDVAEHAELALLFGMVTPLGQLENNPTWKEQLQELAKTKAGKLIEEADKGAKKAGFTGVEVKEPSMDVIEQEAAKSYRTFGFLGYPVLQAADILLYHGTKVPVGKDQLPHLELSREIARKFNHYFGQVFAEPQPLLTPTPKVPGADGRKMSKSYGNTVDIYETADALSKKVMTMYTDPKKLKKDDPGRPEPEDQGNEHGCVVFALHKLYGDQGFVDKRRDECRKGVIGCVACKKDLIAHMEKPFAEFRARREKYAADPKLVDQVLKDGAEKARRIAQKTMSEVRKAMRLTV